MRNVLINYSRRYEILITFIMQITQQCDILCILNFLSLSLSIGKTSRNQREKWRVSYYYLYVHICHVVGGIFTRDAIYNAAFDILWSDETFKLLCNTGENCEYPYDIFFLRYVRHGCFCLFIYIRENTCGRSSSGIGTHRFT